MKVKTQTSLHPTHVAYNPMFWFAYFGFCAGMGAVGWAAVKLVEGILG